MWEKRLSLHAGRMPSEGDCQGEIYARMYTQCSCSQGWESVSDMALWQGQGENLPVCTAGTQGEPMGPKCQIWPNGEKFLQNAAMCEGIRFSLLCADRHVGMWKKALATLGNGSSATLAH